MTNTAQSQIKKKPTNAKMKTSQVMVYSHAGLDHQCFKPGITKCAVVTVSEDRVTCDSAANSDDIIRLHGRHMKPLERSDVPKRLHAAVRLCLSTVA